MYFDDVFDLVGGAGLYQLGQLLYNLALGFITIDAIRMNFLGGYMRHWCKIPQLANFSHAQQKYIAIPDDGDEPSTCSRFDLNFSQYTEDELVGWNRTLRTAGEEEVRCDAGWVYDQSDYISTISSKWDLVCDRGWLVQMVSTCYMGGWLLGCIITGPFSDRFGRKNTVLLCHTVRCVAAFLCLYSPWYEGFAVGRFVMGLTSPHANLTMYIIMAEVTVTKWRSTFLVTWNILTFALGAMIIPGVAFYVRDAFYLEAIYVWPLVYFFVFIYIVDESPRWLIIQGREAEAVKILTKVAKVNKGASTQLPADLNFKEERMKREEAGSKQGHATIIDLFKTPNIRKKTLIIWLNWFTLSLVYYGLSLNANRLPGSVYLNSFLLSAVEVPAQIIAMVLLPRIGRRWLTGGGTLVAGMATLLCIPFILDSRLEAVATGLSVVGKAAAATGFGGIYVFTAELNPTQIRNMALGTASMCARISGMAAPFVGGPLGDIWAALPSLLFGVFGTISGSLILLLPETLGFPLPETIAEAEEFGKSGKKDKVEPDVMIMTVTPESTDVMSNSVSYNSESFNGDLQTRF